MTLLALRSLSELTRYRVARVSDASCFQYLLQSVQICGHFSGREFSDRGKRCSSQSTERCLHRFANAHKLSPSLLQRLCSKAPENKQRGGDNRNGDGQES